MKKIALILLTLFSANVGAEALVSFTQPKHLNPNGKVSSGEKVEIQNPVSSVQGTTGQVALDKHNANLEAKVPTAAEQGFDISAVSEAEAQRLRDKEYESYYSTRAQGKQEKIGGIETQTASIHKGLVSNWTKRLAVYGVTAEKVKFEAKRLNKEDFIDWATNMESGLRELHGSKE